MTVDFGVAVASDNLGRKLLLRCVTAGTAD